MMKKLNKIIPKKSFLVSSFTNILSLVINLTIGFFLTPFIIEKLGLTQYGIWALIISIVGYYGILDLGIASAVLRYLAYYIGQKKNKELNQVVNTSICFFIIFSLVIILSVFLFINQIAAFFHILPEFFYAFKITMYLFAVSTAILLPTNIFNVIIIAHEHFLFRNIVTIISALMKGILMFIVLSNGGGLVAISYVNLTLIIIVAICNILIVMINYPYINLSWKFISRTMIVMLLSFGFYSGIGQIGILLKTRLDSAVIGRFSSLDNVSIYSIGALISGYLMNLIFSFGSVFQPRLATLAAMVDMNDFKKTIKNYATIISTITVGFSLVAFSLIENFYKIWLPDNFKDINTLIIITYILFTVVVLDMINDVFIHALRAINKHKYYAYLTIAEGILNLTLSIFLVKKIGIIGVTLGTLIPTILTKLLIQPILNCLIFKLNWIDIMYKVYFKPIIIAAIMIIIINLNLFIPNANNYFIMAFKGIIILTIYSLIAYFYCFSKNEKEKIINKLPLNYIPFLKKKNNK